MLSRFRIILRITIGISSNVFSPVALPRYPYTCYTGNKLCYSAIPLQHFRNFNDAPSKCWNCDYRHHSELFCSKCNSLQVMPENMTYFDIIGIEKNYNVSPKDLHNKYRQLQSVLHPDRFVKKSEREKQISENISSLVNKAYNTLLHPVSRGLYILRLNGILIPEGTTNVDPEFLMEIMERNEQIEEAFQKKEKIIQLFLENKTILDALTRDVEEAFCNKDFERARDVLVKMKYYIKIENRLKEFKQDLGIVD